METQPREVPCARCGGMLLVDERAPLNRKQYHADCGLLKTPQIAEALALSTRQTRRLLERAAIQPVRACHGMYWNVEFYPRTTAEQLRAALPEALAKAQARHRAAQDPSTQRIDLLSAIFAVTRSAKRYRDAAERCYKLGVHGLARAHRDTKNHCYRLKDRGIVAAVNAGRIAPVATCANLTVYRGEGYCFHSLLRPIDWQPPATVESGEETAPSGSPLVVEAKPRAAKEPRLRDAIGTLGALPARSDWPGFVRIPFPQTLREVPEVETGWQDEEEDEDEPY